MKTIGSKFIPIISIVAFFLLCQLLFNLGLRVSALPSPFDILTALVLLFKEDHVINDILASLGRVLTGFSLAAIVGVSFGLLFAWQQLARRIFNPLIELARPIPPIAWIPFAILVFGLGNTSAVFIVFLGAFFPILISTYLGATRLSRTHRNTCLNYDIRGLSYIKNVLFFQSLPGIMSGLQTGIGMAWMSVIAAELIGAQSGLGYLIQNNRLLLRIDYVMAGMLIIGIIGLSLNLIIKIADKRISRWLGPN